MFAGQFVAGVAGRESRKLEKLLRLDGCLPVWSDLLHKMAHGHGAGTPSFGGRRNKSHTVCRRCGCRSYHIQKGKCASCGFPDAHMRHYDWEKKAHSKRTQGTGRMSHLKNCIERLQKYYSKD